MRNATISRPLCAATAILPVLLGGLALAACDDAEPTPEPPAPLTLDATGLHVREAQGGTERVVLRPQARIDGLWQAAEPCVRQAAGSWHCSVGDDGAVTLALDALGRPTLTLGFVAARAVTLQALALVGAPDLPDATTWLSNGAQSWSQSGAVALAGPVDDATLDKALAAKADAEVLRKGNVISWTMTAIGGGPGPELARPALVVGAVDGTRVRAWMRAERGTDGLLGLRVVAGGTPGDVVALVAGETVALETFYVAAGPERATLRGYAEQLPSWRNAHQTRADAGWNSWYELWDQVDAPAALANAASITTALAPLLPAGAEPLRLVVDDGWQLAWGDWRENAKFPAQGETPGLAVVAQAQAAAGRTMGLWLAPLLVQESAPVAQQHPDWLLADASYVHLKHGKMRVLDVTHPDAAAWLEQTIAGLVGRGIGLLKIDFLFAGLLPSPRHDPSVTPQQSLDRALAVIRKGAGASTVLLAVGAPPLPVTRYCDAWRLGPDIAVENFGPSWFFLPNEARSIAARWPFCRAVLCDADPPVLRTLPQGEVDVGGWIAALPGGAFFLSDDLRSLPTERVGWGVDADRVALGIGGVPAEPIGLLDDGAPPTLTSAIEDHLLQQMRHRVPLAWALPDGRTLLLNLGDTTASHAGASVEPRRARLLPGS